MNAIDTNVLVRIIIRDDESQLKKAVAYVKEHELVFVTIIVLCEFSWVCVSCYGLKRNELVMALENLLRNEQFEVENSDAVWTALHIFKNTNADFSDCIISAIAKLHHCNSIGTFDKKATSIPNFELIK